MAGISDEDIQKVRDANDVVAVIGERVPVKQKGRDFWCSGQQHQKSLEGSAHHTEGCAVQSYLSAPGALGPEKQGRCGG